MSNRPQNSETAQNDSPRPPRGPSLRLVLALAAVLLAGLLVGGLWGGRIADGAAGLWQRIAGEAESPADDGQYYTCGMHPWVILPRPGTCPVCQMNLEPIDPKKFTGEIAIDPVMVQNIGVRIAPVTTGPLERTMRTVGTVAYDETRVRDINVKTPGWIEKLNVDYLGAPVEKGQPLFEFYSPELYAAQEEYLLALKNRGQIGADFVPEAAEGAADLLDAARTRLLYFDITPDQIDKLKAAGKPSKTLPILSPWEGVVIEKHANEGMKVDQGMRVFRIADLDKVWVMVTLYEYQLPYVSLGQTATMTLPYIPGQTWEGKVIYIYPYLNEKTREVKVRLEFDNSQGLLKPGMFANVQLRSKLAGERVLAPRSAVIDTGERKVAFVSLGEGRFEPRNVRTGVSAGGDKVAILDGLKPGEMVVVSGQFLIDSEANIREQLARMIRGDLAADQQAVAAVEGASELENLPPPLADAVNQALAGYFEISTAMFNDTLGGIDAPARKIADGVDRMLKVEIPGHPHFWHRHEEAATVRARALELIDTDDLADARLKLADLSMALAKLIKATGVPPSLGQQVQELHCPMYREGQGGTIWLQPAGEVANPYMGQEMPECFDKRIALPVTGQKPDEPAPPAPADPQEAEPEPARPTVNVDADARAQIDKLVTAYLEMQRLLARNTMQGKAEPLGEMHQAASVLARNEHAAVATSATVVRDVSARSQPDIERQRTAFKEISDAVIALVEAAPAGPEVAPHLRHTRCPMVKADWLQVGEEVANPYSPAMPKCGTFVKLIAPRRPTTQPDTRDE